MKKILFIIICFSIVSLLSSGILTTDGVYGQEGEYSQYPSDIIDPPLSPIAEAEEVPPEEHIDDVEEPEEINEIIDDKLDPLIPGDDSGPGDIIREARITYPGEGEEVSGSVEFTAYITDYSFGGVQWAVRQGTCDAGTNTVLGNVDGHDDPYTLGPNTDPYTYNFTATADTSEWTPGEYCFVFNPREDRGEDDIRLTRKFIVVGDYDSDNDSVTNAIDLCSNTGANIIDKDDLNPNHFEYYGDSAFEAGVSKGKGKGLDRSYTIVDTRGCSCLQILGKLSEMGYGDMEGHKKHGCSIGIMDKWIKVSADL